MVYREFFIRPATNSDIISVKKLVFSVLSEYGLEPDEFGKDKDLNDIEKNYFSGNGYFGVAINIKTNTIIGTFGLFSTGRTICELQKMYLLKEARGKGLGKFILDYSIAIAKDRGYKKITLETISNLVEAISLYKSRGFQEIKPKAINKRVDQAFQLDISI